MGRKFLFSVVSLPGIAWCDRAGMPILHPSASGYRSGSGAGVGLGVAANPCTLLTNIRGGAATTTVGARVSVEDTELMPSQVRQGKQLHVKHRRVSGSSC